MASVTRARRRRATGLLAVVAFLAAVAAASAPAAASAGSERAPGRGAAATPTPAVRLLHQSPVVRTPSGLLSLSLTRSGPALASDASVTLILYSRLTTRSALLAAIGPQGPTTGVSATPGIPASCLARGVELHLTVGVAPDGAAVRVPRLCGTPAPVLRLGCAASCAGVYPLRVLVKGAGTTTVLTTLVTFAARSSMPLRVCWVIRVAGLPGALTGAVPALAALAAHPEVAATLDVQGSTVASNLAAPGATDAVSLLHDTIQSPVHELIAEPYVPADLGGLQASALHTEVTRQFELNVVALQNAGITTAPSRSATYGTGPQTPTMAKAIASVHIPHLLVDGAALGTDPSYALDWGSAFQLSGAGPTPTALATDTPLGQLSDLTAQDPGLTAAQFLGELAFLHFEQPNLPAPRVATVVTTATPTVTTSFVDQVLAGLRANPVLRAVTTSSAFAQVRVGANGFPAIRALALGPSARFPSPTISEIQHLRITTDALSSAVKAGLTPIPSIEGELLSAERVLPTPIRTAMLADVQYRLEQELGHFHIDNGSITLTELTGSLPITILSNAPYTVQGTLEFMSNRLSFPNGDTRPAVLLVPPVVSPHITVHAPTSGDFPLTVLFVSPDHRIVLAHAEITVRATPISAVGVALTIAAIAVLALWWGRTSVRRRRQR